MDTAWSTLHNPWERVRWARLQWQDRVGMETTARAAARSLGIEENTYTLYERPPRSPKSAMGIERARQFGQKFKVSWVWLATGEGTPFETERTFSPEAASVAEKIDSLPEDERKAKAEAIRALLTGT